jgi:SAM-dependent methyltransferase
MSKNNIKEYLEGKKLYGDDFNVDEIQEWFDDEKEGYADLGARHKEKYIYSYHTLNYKYGFRFLPDKEFLHVLGFGSAYGDELKPILKIAKKTTIVDSSDAFTSKQINKFSVNYIKPEINGSLPFLKNSFDLITCFGVLHHIPNVSYVIGEFYRCLKPEGYALVREPIISLGDWTKKRQCLTKRERGIPLNIFRQIISTTGFKIINEKKCMFPFTYRLKYIMKRPVFNSKTALLFDDFLCFLFNWNYRYHAYNLYQKLRPTAVYYVLFKDSKKIYTFG